ncbi:DUF927 domain-containing protein [Acidocella sp.]|jgi:hypothetical protein|uniref:DUF927 domain-containing protein n=1 Tax=Acidocella sp. TaxID=50710 RepID=UPI002F42AAB8
MILTDLIGKDLPPDPCGTQGTLTVWSERANMLFALGCEAQAFTLLASFASPLMSLIETKEGGAALSIHGGKHAGKSVALAAAASVWGGGPIQPPPLSLGPVILNRLANRDPVGIKALIEASVTAPDRPILISASGARLPLDPGELFGIDVEVKVPKALIAPKDGDRIEGHLLANRGHAGNTYLRYITRPENAAWIKRRLAGAIAGIRDDLTAAHAKDDTITMGELFQIERWRYGIRLIAACWVAGIVAVELGLIEADPERIARWAIKEGLE